MTRLVYVGGLAAAALVAAAAPAANAQSLFHCDSAGNGATEGAVIGGVLGGVAGVGVAHNDVVGGVLGAAAGAAAGSWIGCRLQNDEQASLDQATQRALNENRSTSWTNPRTGATARIEVYADNASLATPPIRYGEWMAPERVALAARVSTASGYETVEPRYTVIHRTWMRTAPDFRAPSTGEFLDGDQLDAMAKVAGSPWILVGRGGVGMGYVPIADVSPVVEYATSAYADIAPDSLRLSPGVGWAAAYEPAPPAYTVVRDVDIRDAPASDARYVGRLYRGNRMEAIARVRGTRWVLVGRDGYGVGYVSEDALTPKGPALVPAADECRIVEQTITDSYASDTQRYRACRIPGGGWSMTAI